MSDDKFNEWSLYSIPECIQKALLELKFTKPTPIQVETLLPAIRDYRDILGAAETGSGKTLAFGIPIITHILKDKETANKKSLDEQKSIKALVLVPTRELAIQVHQHLKDISKYSDVKLACIVGGMSEEKQIRILNKMPDIVVATPGRLWQLVELNEIEINSLRSIKYLAIDEADRMVEKGHFDEVRRVLEIMNSRFKSREIEDDEEKKEPKPRQNFVFSATLTFVHKAPKRTQLKKRFKTINETVKLNSFIKLVGMKRNPMVVDLTTKSNQLATLTETKIKCPLVDKDLYLYCFLNLYPGRTLVFCNSINTVIRLKKLLALLGLNPLPLHAKIQMRQRLKNLDRFKENENSLLIATDVAARGLDITKIEHIVHYHMPSTAEIYVHRSGRTARAQKEGHSLLLIEPKEFPAFSKMWRALKRTDDLPQFPVESRSIKEARERVKLAIHIEKIEHQRDAKCSSNNWFLKAAADLDVDMDDKLLADLGDEREKASFNRELNGLKKKLSKMLEIPFIAPDYLKTHPTLKGKANLLPKLKQKNKI